MTPERQRIAIAEACGWQLNPADLFDEDYQHQPRSWVSPKRQIRFCNPPDYLNDLNAMHEAEKVLKGGMRSKYDAELTIIAARDHCFIWETTATQKSEAFLRTIGKWEDDK